MGLEIQPREHLGNIIHWIAEDLVYEKVYSPLFDFGSRLMKINTGINKGINKGINSEN